jgi:vacuolar protein sorting-associated protein 72
MPSQATPFTFNPAQPPPSNLPPPPPAIEHAARNYLILQNFDETAIKEKNVQTQILFGRKFDKVRSKFSHFSS